MSERKFLINVSTFGVLIDLWFYLKVKFPGSKPEYSIIIEIISDTVVTEFGATRRTFDVVHRRGNDATATRVVHELRSPRATKVTPARVGDSPSCAANQVLLMSACLPAAAPQTLTVYKAV